MRKKNQSTKEPKPNKIGFQSSISIYKNKFSKNEITFMPKFSITKKITFLNYNKIANKLSKAFRELKPFIS